jgi:hypothetical protein
MKYASLNIHDQRLHVDICFHIDNLRVLLSDHIVNLYLTSFSLCFNFLFMCQGFKILWNC